MILVYNPSGFVFVLLGLSTSVLAFLLLIFEYPYDQYAAFNGNISASVQGWGSSIYLIIITLTTVGYGDVLPHTDGGNIVCLITAVWGGFIASLLILIVSNVFALTDV